MGITTYPGLFMQYNYVYPVHLADIETVVEGLRRTNRLNRLARQREFEPSSQCKVDHPDDGDCRGRGFAGQTVEPWCWVVRSW